MKTVTTLLVLLITATLVGCGDGGEAVLKRRSNLQQLGDAYLRFHTENGKSPKGASELIDFMSGGAEDEKTTDAITALEEGDITMIWTANIYPEESENAKYLLGFEAGVPSTGGYVVMGDSQVKLMTGKDYAEAKTIPPAP